MRLALKSLVATLITPLLLAGCGTENRSSSLLAPEVPSAPSQAEIQAFEGWDLESSPSWGSRLSKVMFIHASPDAPAVDIYAGYRRAARNLGFPNNTSYKSVFSGERPVRVNVAGTSNSVIDATVPFQPRKSYSIFAINRVSVIEPLLVEDNLMKPARGKANVRFLHLSPDAPAVDVAVKNGPVVFGNLSFKGYTAFTALPAGTYDLEVRVAGTSTVALSLPGVKFEEGRIYSVFARGFLQGSGAQALGAGIIVNNAGSRRNDRGDDDDDELWQAAAPAAN